MAALDARVMLAMRFAYGIRLPLPIVCGTSGIAPGRFFRYNLATALAWALAFTLCGYAVGTAALVALHRVAHYGAWLLGASLAAGFGMHLLLRHRAKRLT